MKIRIRYRNNTGEVKDGIARAFRIGFTLLSMTAAALLAALVTVRVAIHAAQVEVPDLQGLTLDEASDKTHDGKLNLTVENRFYSTTVPAGRVLSQFPAPGTDVRKGWHMRITESIGPQRVAIPDTLGMDERDAAAAIRRASLDVGTQAHLPAPGPAGTVLAQTPPPNAEGVDKPEVSLLLSQPLDAAPRAYVMPNLVGLSFSAARARMKELELPLFAIVPQITAQTASSGESGSAAAAPVISGPVVSQVPIAGSRVTAADSPHVTMHAYVAPQPAPPAAPATPAAAPQNAAPIVRQQSPATH